MKVLFISSANKGDISPIVKAQGQSLEQIGVEIQYFGIKGKGLGGYLKNIKALRQYIKQYSPDILHAHYGLSAIIALIAKGKEKIICSYMGDDLLGSNKDGGSISLFSKVLIRGNIFLANHVYAHAIVKSEEMCKSLRSGKYSVVPNGVNTDFFRPGVKAEARKKLGLPEKENIVLFISNPSRPEKNFQLAQDSMDYVNKAGSKLITVYDVNHADIPVYMNAGDVVLLTSYHEGSPNVIKEAMACNCPIVTTRVGDVHWVIDQVLGCLLASYEPEDVGMQLNLALDFASAHDRTVGRQRIFELGLDSKSTAERIIGVYNNVLK